MEQLAATFRAREIKSSQQTVLRQMSRGNRGPVIELGREHDVGMLIPAEADR
jgi:hypothetical protein